MFMDLLLHMCAYITNNTNIINYYFSYFRMLILSALHYIKKNEKAKPNIYSSYSIYITMDENNFTNGPNSPHINNTTLCKDFTNCPTIASGGLCLYHHVFCGYDCDLLRSHCDAYHTYENAMQKSAQILRGDDIDSFRLQIYKMSISQYAKDTQYRHITYADLCKQDGLSSGQRYCKSLLIPYYYSYPLREYRRRIAYTTHIRQLIAITLLLIVIYINCRIYL